MSASGEHITFEPQPVTPPPPASRDAGPTRRRRRRTPVSQCLNCGTPVSGHYCPHCGQETHDQSVAISTLASEMVSEIASFDSKLIRTVLPLLFRPGFLTNEFLVGRRVRYLSPLKMYLVISAVFFFLLAQQNASQQLLHIKNGASHTLSAKVPLQAAPVLAQVANDLKTDAEDQDNSPKERAVLEAARAKIQKALTKSSSPAPAQPAATSPQTGTSKTNFNIDLGNIDTDNLPASVADYDLGQRALPPAKRDGATKRFFKRQLIKTQQSPQQLISNLFDDLPRMMFVLLPVFALLLKMTYWRTRRLYVEHLIFALHTHAFVFLLLTGTLLAVHLPHVRDASAVATLLLLVYLGVALKIVYRQGWGRTVLALSWLGFNYVILLAFAFLLTFGVAFMTA